MLFPIETALYIKGGATNPHFWFAVHRFVKWYSVFLADTRRASHVVVFFCKHVYHEDCLPARDVVSHKIFITFSFLTRIRGTPQNAETLACYTATVCFILCILLKVHLLRKVKLLVFKNIAAQPLKSLAPRSIRGLSASLAALVGFSYNTSGGEGRYVMA